MLPCLFYIISIASKERLVILLDECHKVDDEAIAI